MYDQAGIEVGAGGRLVGGVDVVGGGASRRDLTLHRVDNVRHGLNELTEGRPQLGAWMPARQHHAVSVIATDVTSRDTLLQLSRSIAKHDPRTTPSGYAHA